MDICITPLSVCLSHTHTLSLNCIIYICTSLSVCLQDAQIAALAAQHHTDVKKLKKSDLILDSGGNVIGRKGRIMDELTPLDHTLISYPPIKKDLYIEHPDITNMTPSQISEIQTSLQIKTRGFEIPTPVCSFGYFNFDQRLLQMIAKQGFTTPSAIQAQAVPAALKGRDVMGIAKTGH